MTHGLAIEPEHWEIIISLLAKHLPSDATVWAYGSRATGKGIWRGSDLDLMIRAQDALPWTVMGSLAEDFSESLLPFMVDLHDWHETSAAFLERIQPDMVPLPLSLAQSQADRVRP